MSWLPHLTCAALALSLSPGGSFSRPVALAGAMIPNQVEVSGGGAALDANLQLGSGGYNSRGGRSRSALVQQRQFFGGNRSAGYGGGGLYARDRYNARQWSNTYVPSSYYRQRASQTQQSRPSFSIPPVDHRSDPVVVVARPQSQTGTGDRAPAAKSPSQNDQLSYGLGFYLGQEVTSGLTADGLQGNLEMIVRGFAAGLQGQEPNVPQEEIDAVMIAVHQEMERRMVARLLEEDPVYKKQYEENEAAGAAYLAKNGAEEGVTTLSNGIQIRTIKSGDGLSPTATDTVVIRFTATLVDGTEIESDDAEEVAVGSVIAGGAHVLQMMKVGDRWDVAFPADLAYGGVGRAPTIGPNAVILVDVELVDIK